MSTLAGDTERPAETTEKTPCPEGVPQEIWDEFLADTDTYVDEWAAAVQEHVAEYDKKHPEPAEE